MADGKDTVLDRAEGIARRLLERLGNTVDNKLNSDSANVLSPRAISDLASRIEKVVDSDLEEDEKSIRRVAPNHFRVQLTYEETSDLSPQYIEAVGKELSAIVLEYITNRRYVTRGPVTVIIARDMFAKTTAVKSSFQSEAGQARVETESKTDQKTVEFMNSDGRQHRVKLRVGSFACIGRAAGNALAIDDPSVSRLHCSLSLRVDGAIVVADLGSANGTYVNERPLARDEACSITTGDAIGVGDFVLTVSDIL